MDTNVADMARWNNTTVVSLVCVVALALSGCLTASAATAKEHQGKATDEAQSEWAADAQLVGIFGMEGTNQGWEEGPWGAGEDQSENYFASAEDDEDVGDGRSEVWAYGYQADSKPDEFYIVFFDKDGDRQGDMTVPAEDDMLPIGDYDLNSDEAVDKAKAAEDGIESALETENHFMVVFLAKADDHPNPVWSVMAGGGGQSDDGSYGGGGGFAVVDAVTGEVLAHFGGSGSGSSGWDWQ